MKAVGLNEAINKTSEVKNPGSRGGHYWFDSQGQIQYGERPLTKSGKEIMHPHEIGKNDNDAAWGHQQDLTRAAFNRQHQDWSVQDHTDASEHLQQQLRDMAEHVTGNKAARAESQRSIEHVRHIKGLHDYAGKMAGAIEDGKAKAQAIGQTNSGKHIQSPSSTAYSSPGNFAERHQDWTLEDHQDAIGLHSRKGVVANKRISTTDPDKHKDWRERQDTAIKDRDAHFAAMRLHEHATVPLHQQAKADAERERMNTIRNQVKAAGGSETSRKMWIHGPGHEMYSQLGKDDNHTRAAFEHYNTDDHKEAAAHHASNGNKDIADFHSRSAKQSDSSAVAREAALKAKREAYRAKYGFKGTGTHAHEYDPGKHGAKQPDTVPEQPGHDVGHYKVTVARSGLSSPEREAAGAPPLIRVEAQSKTDPDDKHVIGSTHSNQEHAARVARIAADSYKKLVPEGTDKNHPIHDAAWNLISHQVGKAEAGEHYPDALVSDAEKHYKAVAGQGQTEEPKEKVIDAGPHHEIVVERQDREGGSPLYRVKGREKKKITNQHSGKIYQTEVGIGSTHGDKELAEKDAKFAAQEFAKLSPKEAPEWHPIHNAALNLISAKVAAQHMNMNPGLREYDKQEAKRYQGQAQTNYNQQKKRHNKEQAVRADVKKLLADGSLEHDDIHAALGDKHKMDSQTTWKALNGMVAEGSLVKDHHSFSLKDTPPNSSKLGRTEGGKPIPNPDSEIFKTPEFMTGFSHYHAGDHMDAYRAHAAAQETAAQRGDSAAASAQGDAAAKHYSAGVQKFKHELAQGKHGAGAIGTTSSGKSIGGPLGGNYGTGEKGNGFDWREIGERNAQRFKERHIDWSPDDHKEAAEAHTKAADQYDKQAKKNKPNTYENMLAGQLASSHRSAASGHQSVVAADEKSKASVARRKQKAAEGKAKKATLSDAVKPTTKRPSNEEMTAQDGTNLSPRKQVPGPDHASYTAIDDLLTSQQSNADRYGQLQEEIKKEDDPAKLTQLRTEARRLSDQAYGSRDTALQAFINQHPDLNGNDHYYAKVHHQKQMEEQEAAGNAEGAKKHSVAAWAHQEAHRGLTPQTAVGTGGITTPKFIHPKAKIK